MTRSPGERDDRHDDDRQRELEEERERYARAQEDREQYGFFFLKYFDTVFRYIHVRLWYRANIRNPDLVDELTQETFFEALKGFWKLGFLTQNLEGWFIRIAKTRVDRYFERSPHRREEPFSATSHDLHVPADVEEDLQVREQREILRQCLGAIGEQHAEIIVLRYYHERSIKEIAQILRVRPGAVRTRLSRAKAALAAEVSRFEREGRLSAAGGKALRELNAEMGGIWLVAPDPMGDGDATDDWGTS